MRVLIIACIAAIVLFAVWPAEATSTFICVPHTRYTVTGSAAPSTALLLHFDGHAVGGGTSDGTGHYRLPLDVGDVKPGQYLFGVEDRGSHRMIKEASCVVGVPGTPETIQEATAVVNSTSTSVSTSSPANTPIPSVTPTISDATATTQTDIVNGDFEQGDVGWKREKSAYIIKNEPTISYSHNGSYSALLGSSSSELSQISQRLIIPSDRPYLSFWYTSSSSQADCSYDTAHIWLDPHPGDSNPGMLIDTLAEFCHGSVHSTYQHHVTDLSQYAGQTMDVEFVMDTNVNYGSHWVLDDISFQAAP